MSRGLTFSVEHLRDVQVLLSHLEGGVQVTDGVVLKKHTISVTHVHAKRLHGEARQPRQFWWVFWRREINLIKKCFSFRVLAGFWRANSSAVSNSVASHPTLRDAILANILINTLNQACDPQVQYCDGLSFWVLFNELKSVHRKKYF